MILLAIILSAMFPFIEIADSTEITVKNNLIEERIETMHLLLPGRLQLIPVMLESPVQPGCESTVTVPFSFMERVIFATDAGSNYRITNYSPAGQSPEIQISLAEKEFGGFFDVILGTERFVLMNETPVPLSGIFLHADGLPDGNVMGSNPVLPSEIVFLWLNSDTIRFHAVDIQGNASLEITSAKSNGENTIKIRPSDFLFDLPQPQPGTVHVINCINGERITEVEVYPEVLEPFLVDLTETPLSLWQSTSIPVQSGIEFIVCIDTSGRTYFVNTVDQETNAYLVDWWSLDFDFRFPDRSE